VRELRSKPAGTIRITATEFAIDTVPLPKLAPLLREHSDIKVEMIADYGLTDIVMQQYDAGVRSGEQVAKDMIAVRIAENRGPRRADRGALDLIGNRFGGFRAIDQPPMAE
jgi:DNA-binding transcriptional LysR family regulator